MTATDHSEKLSFWQKAAYAVGDLGNSAGPGTIIPFWYLYFLTDMAGLTVSNFHKFPTPGSQNLHHFLLSYVHSIGGAVRTAPHSFTVETAVG